VGQAGVTIDQVVTSVKHVTEIMTEITAASQEQSAGIERVNHAIIEMDGVTQQNAALVEQAAAAAQSLQDQAAELANVVGVFKLDKNEGLLSFQSAPAKPAAPVVKRIEPAMRAAKSKAKASPVKSLPAKPAVKKAASAASDDGWEDFD
jgi:methyl-accepting chemotaxis protein